MNRPIVLKHEFVQYIPEQLENGTVYVSIEFATAAHRCCCGCGREVTTPISPTDWTLLFHGDSVSLDPSIGNWNFPCQSHYFIRRNRVMWAKRWTPAQIDAGRAHDSRAKQQYFSDKKPTTLHESKPPEKSQPKDGFWRRLKKRFS